MNLGMAILLGKPKELPLGDYANSLTEAIDGLMVLKGLGLCLCLNRPLLLRSLLKLKPRLDFFDQGAVNFSIRIPRE